MGFTTRSVLKVWEVHPLENTNAVVRLKVTHSYKKKDSEEWVQDFNEYVSVVGTAMAQKARSLKSGDLIMVNLCDVTNTYDKEKKQTFYNFSIRDFEKFDPKNPSKKSAPKEEVATPDSNAEEGGGLPF